MRNTSIFRTAAAVDVSDTRHGTSQENPRFYWNLKINFNSKVEKVIAYLYLFNQFILVDIGLGRWT